MQQILDLLRQYGMLGGQQGWQDVGNISPSTIAGSLAGSFGISDQHLPSTLFQGIGQSSMQNLLGKTYSPFMDMAQGPLITDLLAKTGGKQARAAAGGIAGSGGYQQYQKGVKDVYGKGMTETLGGIGEQQAKQQASIMDLIDSWRQTATSIKYTG